MKPQITIKINDLNEVDKYLAELGAIEASLQHEEAILNEQEQKARQEFKERTENLFSRKADILTTLERFCIANKNEFEKTRLLEFVHGIIGFRTTPPKVTMLNRKYNINTVLELLKKFKLTKYIRTKEELDKESVLADYAAKEISDPKLASVGLKIDQSEIFVCEPKWEETGKKQ
ncbi:MAG TPA: host-nuclease inhibitor Gam family protein [Bacteroidota bacterium]|nr:host-nuclease inhibitor Gam family protein [Bacteroidota bacterium]